ncbi:uncharacterized protein LOC144880392 [Branchiostoma floridae x Branchiostoma japonicum]
MGPSPEAEFVAAQDIAVSAKMLRFRDPDSFRAGELHRNVKEWERIASDSAAHQRVLNWIKNKVDITEFMVPFKGNFQGRIYDNPYPPKACFSNGKACKDHVEFITKELRARLAKGAIRLWGKVGECEPPHLIMPITVEPSKPRLCCDQRFLNCWIKDTPFTLETLRDVPRMVPQGSFLTSVDDKSGYDHLLVTEDSQTLLGFQWGGYIFVCCSIPFGFRTSAFLYQTTGMVATSYVRSLGVPTSQYIDDRLAAELLARLRNKSDRDSHLDAANAAIFILCQILIRLGYFLGLGKSILIPTQIIIHLARSSELHP